MKLIVTYGSSDIPMWLQELDEDNLRTVWQQGNSFYAIDIKSAYPLKKGLLKNSEYIFRFKYAASTGSIFYIVAFETEKPALNPITDRVRMISGVQILNGFILKNNKLCEYQWEDDFLPLQGEGDPMHKLVYYAKHYESETPPLYVKELIT